MSETKTVPEAPEDSKALRAVVFVMAVLCVVSSSFFVKTDWWMTAIYLVLIVVGSFLSYKVRHRDPRWLKAIWWVGILLVGANALHEFTSPLHDEFDMVSPFVHFLCGVFAFVTFSMKTRSDLNTASGLGLILICLSAPVAKGMPYGACIFGYLVLGALMMYYDCVSRTLTSWLSKPMLPAPEVQLLQRKAGRRIARGNTVLLLTVMPLMAVAMFIYVPRADEFLDRLWAYTKTMKLEYLTDMFWKTAAPPPPVSKDPRVQHAGRTWFDKNKDAKQLPMLGVYKTKSKEELEMLKQIDEARKKAPVVEKTERSKKEEHKPEKKPDTKDGTKEDPKDKKDPKNKKEKGKLELTKEQDNVEKSKADRGEKSNPTKDVKAKDPEEKKAPEKTDAKKPEKKDLPPPDQALKEKAARDADRDAPKDVAKAAAKAKAEAAKAKAEGKPDPKPDAKDGDGKKKSPDTKSGANEKSAEKHGDGKGKEDAAKSGEGKDGKGKDAAKHGGSDGKGSGKSKHGGGDGPGGGKKAKGRGKIIKDTKDATKAPPEKPPKPAEAPSIGGDNNLKVEAKNYDLDERLVMTVKSRRLVYLRRQIYDNFNGRVWKRSAPSKKVPLPDTVKVIDGEVKREPKKVQPVKLSGGTIQNGGQMIVPAAPMEIVRGSQPSVFGNTNPQPSVLSSNTQAITPPEPIRVEAKVVPAQTDDEDSEKKDNLIHPYAFEQTEKPIFRVGMADALKVDNNLPTVELVQDIKINAKTIGVVIPGGWIQQEVKLPKAFTKVNVDQFGMITAPAPLNKGMEFKVKTELPIYPIEAMRSELPLSAKVEDSLRTEYAQYLQLPDTVTEELFKLAEDNSDPRYNWFVQSQQICDFLRTKYEYDKMRDVDPDSKDLVQDFLFDRKRGNSTDFASAFVVMTRCVGIPSRMVSGFAPGDWNQISGEQEVKIKHAHGWAEVYIPSFGWVPFDATPDGVLPSQQRENRYSQKDVEKQLGLDKRLMNVKITDVINWIVAGIISLAVGFVAFKVLVALYRRWREGHFGRGPEWRLYKKVAKSIKKSMRLSRAPSETPTDFLERVRSVVAEQAAAGKKSPEMLPAALETFLKSYSAVYFGKRTEELEHLKYHALEVTKVTRKIKPADAAVAEQKSAVRRKDKFDESTTASAVRRKK